MSTTRLATIALRQRRMRSHDVGFALLMALAAIVAMTAIVFP